MSDAPRTRHRHSGMEIHAELSRDLDLTAALAIGVGTMIAAGIFTLSGLAVKYVGSSAIVAFLLAATVATFTALTYCEFSSIYPESGEGYLYARKTFAPGAAYFVGWALFLGYTSSCAFYIASLSSYFNEFVVPLLLRLLGLSAGIPTHSAFGFLGLATLDAWPSFGWVIHLPWGVASGLVGLVLLVLLNLKGTKESGSFQVVVTVTKVLLLLWFVGGGMLVIDFADVMGRFSTDVAAISKTSALVFITFFGFSAIAASAGEVQDPTRNIPRAIFISMGLVTVLYTLVIMVVVGAGLSEYTEAAMGTAARKFLGGIGGGVIIMGALFSMISASNASIMAGSRVVLSMSQLGHLPRFVAAIHPRTRTPIAALAVVGMTIAVFTLLLFLEDLAHFADAVLLMALITVNFALISHRKIYPNLQRPFRVPMVPVIPLLGIAANAYLLYQALHHRLPALLALGSLALGLVLFLVWKGTQVEEAALPGAPSRVALVRAAVHEARFRVLVPIANPANVEALVELAAATCNGDGEIVALRVIQVPEQLPARRGRSYVERERRILEQAYDCGDRLGIPVTTVVRIGRNIARAVLETSREHKCDLIVLGWKGYASTAQKILGETIDSVVAHARTDIMLVKLTEDKPNLKRILLPSAGGEHARKAEQYAASLVKAAGGELTLCTVVGPEADSAAREAAEERIEAAVKRVREAQPGMKVTGLPIEHTSVTVGLLKEAENHDAVMVGAAGQSFYPQILFGSIPESIAKHSGKPVIMVKSYHPVKHLVGRVIGS